MEILQNIMHGDWFKGEKKTMILGKVVLMKKNVLDLNDFHASFLDDVHEFLGHGVSVQLVSAVHGDPAANGLQGKRGKPVYLEERINAADTPLKAGESAFKLTFDWEEEIGVPGAFLIKNNHHNEFYLKTLTLEDVPGHGRVHFVCNSWVYPADKYENDRVFFANQTYLPSETPEPLRIYRERELVNLRGDGTGELKEWDRVYDYAYYNDLGDPDRGSKYARHILGGSAEYPYPRRGRTSRTPTKTDPKSESRLPLGSGIYVPRDEIFGHLKLSDFRGYTLKSVGQFLVPELKSLLDSTINEFDTFEDITSLFQRGVDHLHDGLLLAKTAEKRPFEMLKKLVGSDGNGLLKLPVPQVIQENKSAWMTDEEFARQMLAGADPVVIRRLHEFPPASKLNQDIYGDQTSSITKKDIEHNLNGQTIEEVIADNKLFILDHHDTLMPYIRRINTTTTKTYATRTVLFLKEDGTLKPLAIELSLPHPDGDKFGVISQVCTPGQGVQGSIWQLAKAYVAVNDSGVHQLISHWLNTHAVVEPFVIATNRQLSSLHPIHKLLKPHFHDTMNINASARQILVNAGGILESTFFPAKYAMEMSAVIYKDYWVFPDQALPADLIKRGMAVEDIESPHGIRLIIEDYPYAVDGLEIWFAMKTWVQDYCSFYYTTDEEVQKDSELQSWWHELVSEGHGDKKDEPWWPKMQTVEELTETCTIIMWIASALHAAVNFGQYPYGGYPPNRPTVSRRLMPQPKTQEYVDLESNLEKAYLKTITAQMQTILAVSLTEILSSHSTDEVYLGQRDTPEWTADAAPIKAFKNFGQKIEEIANRITEMNNDKKLKNRVGQVNMPYTLLYPTSESGMTGKGIPNSVSI